MDLCLFVDHVFSDGHVEFPVFGPFRVGVRAHSHLGGELHQRHVAVALARTAFSAGVDVLFLVLDVLFTRRNPESPCLSIDLFKRVHRFVADESSIPGDQGWAHHLVGGFDDKTAMDR